MLALQHLLLSVVLFMTGVFALAILVAAACDELSEGEE